MTHTVTRGTLRLILAGLGGLGLGLGAPTAAPAFFGYFGAFVTPPTAISAAQSPSISSAAGSVWSRAIPIAALASSTVP